MSFLQVYKSTAAVGLSVNSNPGAHISMEIVLAHLTLLHRSGHHRVQDLQSTRAGVDHFGTCWVICLLQHKNLEATSTCGCSAQPTDKQQPFLPLCLLLSDFIERFIICGRSGERSRFANQRQEKSPQYPSGLSVRSCIFSPQRWVPVVSLRAVVRCPADLGKFSNTPNGAEGAQLSCSCQSPNPGCLCSGELPVKQIYMSRTAAATWIWDEPLWSYTLDYLSQGCRGTMGEPGSELCWREET
ncbi:hypothetical protein AGIG_G2424 [Arapaima gigas]